MEQKNHVFAVDIKVGTQLQDTALVGFQKKIPALYLRHEALLSRIILSISHLVLYGFIFLK